MMRGRFLASMVAIKVAFALEKSTTGAIGEFESQFTKLGCTTVVVGPKATVDGSAMTTHNADCLNCDFRLALTPGKSHVEGSPKAVLKYKADYPHWVTSDRSPVWAPENLDSELPQAFVWATSEFRKSLVVGYLPEVAHTYSLVEGLFGIMNEKGVAIGESTCASVWFGKPPRACPDCEGPLVDASMLSVLALERCDTARCAIETIGGLAQSLGYYAADVSQVEGGEALSIIDAHEAWMLHILPDEDGTGAVWVAQKLKDDHVAVCANAFVIRDVHKDRPNEFLHSDNLWSAAEEAGLWSSKSGQPLDFAAVYGVNKGNSAYSTRRQWRVLDLVAPSLHLPADVDWLGNGLPFSAKVDRKLHVRDVMALKRDFYAGSEFDLTKGVAGGPYGDPRRWDAAVDTPYNRNNVSSGEESSGGFERAISIMRTSYSQISVSRASSPANELTKATVWVAQYAPHMSVYTPIYVATGVPEAVPAPLSTGNLFHFSPQSAFWQACSVGNWAGHFFKYAFEDVRAVQSTLEKDVFARQAEVEAFAEETLRSTGIGGGSSAAAASLVELSSYHCAQFVAEYSALFYNLIAKYHDGYSLADPTAVSIDMRRLFYPKWWLKVAGFWTDYDFAPDVSAPFNSSIDALGSPGPGGGMMHQPLFSSSLASPILLWIFSYVAVAAVACFVSLRFVHAKNQNQARTIGTRPDDNRFGGNWATPRDQTRTQPLRGGGLAVELSSFAPSGSLRRQGYSSIPGDSAGPQRGAGTSSSEPPISARPPPPPSLTSVSYVQRNDGRVSLGV